MRDSSTRLEQASLTGCLHPRLQNMYTHPSPPAGAAISQLLFNAALVCLGSRDKLCQRVKGKASCAGVGQHRRQAVVARAGTREVAPARADVRKHRRRAAVSRAGIGKARVSCAGASRHGQVPPATCAAVGEQRRRPVVARASISDMMS